MRKFYYELDKVRDGIIDVWEYCPLCGYQGIDVYTGDYRGTVQCLGMDCEFELDFTLSYEDVDDNEQDTGTKKSD